MNNVRNRWYDLSRMKEDKKKIGTPSKQKDKKTETPSKEAKKNEIHEKNAAKWSVEEINLLRNLMQQYPDCK